MILIHSPHFEVHAADTQETGQLVEHRVVVQGTFFAVGVWGLEAEKTSVVVQLAAVAVLLDALPSLLHVLLQKLFDVGMPGGWDYLQNICNTTTAHLPFPSSIV